MDTPAFEKILWEIGFTISNELPRLVGLHQKRRFLG